MGFNNAVVVCPPGCTKACCVQVNVSNPQIVLPVPPITVQAQYAQQNPYANTNTNNPQIKDSVQIMLNHKMLILKNQKQWEGPINI